MKPKLKPPGTKRLKLQYDGLLSSFAFNFNLRRYTTEIIGQLRVALLQVMHVREVQPGSYCSPRHRELFDSRNEGSERVG
jgi:hypothetical protein